MSFYSFLTTLTGTRSRQVCNRLLGRLSRISASFAEVRPMGSLGKPRVCMAFVAGLAALGLFFGAMGRARSDFIYFNQYEGFGGKIWRANLDGSGMEIFAHGLAQAGAPALDVAGGKMYGVYGFFGTGGIQRANLD